MGSWDKVKNEADDTPRILGTQGRLAACARSALRCGLLLRAWRVSPRLRAVGRTSNQESICMGKGDRKTRRGKIYRGSFGKSRPKDPAKQRKKAAAKK
jgi:30S ribosomal protein S31